MILRIDQTNLLPGLPRAARLGIIMVYVYGTGRKKMGEGWWQMGVGKSIKRVDAYEKVTGRAMFTDDLCPKGALVAKIVRSTIANGWVKSFDLSEAQKVPGVVKILTCFDSPQINYPTPGHPWSTDESHQDVCDRQLLNRRVRIYGDDIGVVVADDEVAAARAVKLIKVEYEEYPALTSPEAAMAQGASQLHDASPNNLLKQTHYITGNEQPFDEGKAGADHIISGHYETQAVQHCHMEVPVSYAYKEKERIVVVSSTQIPHIVRRVIGQAMGIPWGKVRVIKPYIGGGFGNKQEVLYEPLNAWVYEQIGGRLVKIELSREETFACTRTRHAIAYDLESAVNKEGKLIARRATAVSHQGGYASHGHAIVLNGLSAYRILYQDETAIEQIASTVYSNIASGGAMRGYGCPQAMFAAESHMDDIALALGLDPIEVRKQSHIKLGHVDPLGIPCLSIGLTECLDKGKAHIEWDEKRTAYQHQTGNLRRGVGMSMFSYKSNVYPISLETSSARIVLNQDGSVQLQVGATEIGQGADTVMTQMCAEVIGLRDEDVHLISAQDTDVTPFDTGAYASRQTYTTGMAVKQTAEIFRQKVLDYAEYLHNIPAGEMEICEDRIERVSDGSVVTGLEVLATEAFYNLKHSQHITAESTYHCEKNTLAFGACFVEIEVDIALGRIEVIDVINVHDSGVLINPQLAEAQVHGGMSMGLGYALSEQMLFDPKSARLLNDNLLDYKLPTSMDTPELHVDFVQTIDPSGPFGNKALGEPPAIPVAPAIRNALLHATGVAINSLPLNPPKLVAAFTAAGLTKEGGR